MPPRRFPPPASRTMPSSRCWETSRFTWVTPPKQPKSSAVPSARIRQRPVLSLAHFGPASRKRSPRRGADAAERSQANSRLGKILWVWGWYRIARKCPAGRRALGARRGVTAGVGRQLFHARRLLLRDGTNEKAREVLNRFKGSNAGGLDVADRRNPGQDSSHPSPAGQSIPLAARQQCFS